MSARCRVCDMPLDEWLAQRRIDTHPACEPAVEPMLPQLASILERHQAGQARSLQRTIGPSEIGEPCDRALAYRLAGVPKREGLMWAPFIGSCLHDAGIEPALRAENERLGRERYLIEQRVTVSERLGVTGRCDCFDDDTRTVYDWKLISKASMTSKRRHGPGDVYRTQAHLYGLGWHNAGRTPARVSIVMLPKWSVTIMDGYEWSEPWSKDLAEAALARLDRMTNMVELLGFKNGPADFGLIAGNTGDESLCTWCSWRRPGGPADETGCPGNTAQIVADAANSFSKGIAA